MAAVGNGPGCLGGSLLRPLVPLMHLAAPARSFNRSEIPYGSDNKVGFWINVAVPLKLNILAVLLRQLFVGVGSSPA